MIFSRRFFLLALVSFIPIVVTVASAGTDVSMLLLADVLLVLAAAADSVAARLLRSTITIERVLPDVFVLARPAAIEYRIANTGRVTRRVIVREVLPDQLGAAAHTFRRRLTARAVTGGRITVRPNRKGYFTIGPCHVRLLGPFGLAWAQYALKNAVEVEVLPEVSTGAREDLLAQHSSRERSGLHLLKHRGEGMEFESLREYRWGDEFRHIDWKATARRGYAVVRTYEAERDQRVMIMLDCGRGSSALVDDYLKFDLVVNSALSLAQVATLKGDFIGAVTFSSEIKSEQPPARGRAALHNMVEMFTRTDPDHLAPDYPGAFIRLSQMTRRRSLLVMFTDVFDIQGARELLKAAQIYARRHLLVVVTVRDPEVYALRRKAPADYRHPFRVVAAQNVIGAREAVLKNLRESGAITVDVPATQLTAAVINSYLSLKARGSI